MDKLDAAIGWLRMGVDFHEESHYDRDSCYAAIRVLGAAANVDKARALRYINFNFPNDEDWGVQALIATLPDKSEDNQ